MTAMPLEGLDILVVESDCLVATELARLRELGADVVGPVSRMPLDRSVASRPNDVALRPVQLRDGTRFPLADEMARRGGPVALVTGYAADVLPAPRAALPRLDKPIEPGKLTEAVLRLCGRHQGEAA